MDYSQTKHAKLFLGLAAAALLAGGAARAADPRAPGIEVSAHDLDLRTQSGEAVLRHRVKIAANKLCGQEDVSVSIVSDAFTSCVRDAVQGATPRVQALVDTARGQDHYVASASPRG
jgi:UrcA family protein